MTDDIVDRIVTWLLVAMVGSIATIMVTGALMFFWLLIEAVIK